MLRGKVFVTLIIGVAFIMSGGISQVAAEDNLTVKGFLKRAGPELLEITEVEFIKGIEVVATKVIGPAFMEATKPVFVEQWVDPADGLTKFGGKQKSLKEIMCAKDPGLLTPEECLFVGQ